MLTKRQRLFLAMMQGFRQQQPMLVLRLSANNDLLDLGTFLMGNTYDILKVLLIEAFFSRDILDVINGSTSPTILSKGTLYA